MSSCNKIEPFYLIDAFRGFAALWVVMCHAMIPFVLREKGHYLGNPIYYFSSYGALGIIIFFVLSGYCIMGAVYSCESKGKGVSSYFLNRIRRIYPPYLATCILAICFITLIGFAQGQHLISQTNQKFMLSDSWKFWLTNLSITQVEFGQPDLVIVFWTLCYEVSYYVIIGFLFFVIKKIFCIQDNNKITGLFSFFIFIINACSLFLLIFYPLICPFPLTLWYPFGLGALYFLMVACQNGPNKMNYSNPKIHLLISVFLVAFLAVNNSLTFEGRNFVDFAMIEKPSVRIQAIASIVFLCLLVLMRPYDKILIKNTMVRYLCNLGIISYSLYLTHTLVEPIVDVLLRKAGLDKGLYLYNYTLQILFSVLFGWVFYIILERHFISSRQRNRVLNEQLQSSCISLQS